MPTTTDRHDIYDVLAPTGWRPDSAEDEVRAAYPDAMINRYDPIIADEVVNYIRVLLRKRPPGETIADEDIEALLIGEGVDLTTDSVARTTRNRSESARAALIAQGAAATREQSTIQAVSETQALLMEALLGL